MERHALIAGVSGIIGRHLAEHLLATKGWTVTGISRHKHDLPEGVRHVALDLSEGVKAALQPRTVQTCSLPPGSGSRRRQRTAA